MSESKRICLMMMIKDEATIIERCLNSVVDLIDYWVVCDTGSSDGTQALVQHYFDSRDVPGELHQHEWKNFGHNRSLALACAKDKEDYILIADADQVFQIHHHDFKSDLKHIAYYCYNVCGSLKYKLPVLLKADQDWHYVGVTHEYLDCTSDSNYLLDMDTLSQIIVEERHDGANHTVKFENDIRLLQQGLEDEPKNSRYLFYLARSYEDTLSYELAIEYYLMRVNAGGWAEEIYYSYFAITRCLIKLKRPFGEILEAGLRAYEYRPTRLESMHVLIRYCRQQGYNDTGYLLGQSLVNQAFPLDDILFIHHDVYHWTLKDEVAVCAYQVGAYREALNLNQDILSQPNLPETERQRIKKNLMHTKNKLH